MTLQQILGIEKKKFIIANPNYPNHVGSKINPFNEGYNFAVDELSAWRFDREKLAEILWIIDTGIKSIESRGFKWKDTILRDRYLFIADAILDNLKDVLIKDGK